ncbi:ferredoxin-type protein NapF [Nitrincola alkalilacustris]|uniref:ferredoxin-type protein NapF n=1 Tax=Nitrincola alkalilacustris TaxID=1571224 RepID=UPI00124CCF53|nr:ferredoxin-type protein NapF [Nitrincola alkalilacustris]
MTISISRRQLLRGGRMARPVRRPPWTSRDFTDLCTRCTECISACPEKILYRGDGGFPEINFTDRGCTLCNECARACPESVFDLTRAAFSWQAEISDACLAMQNVHCQICQDQCEARAIGFKPRLRAAPVPVIDTDACTGCGHCLPGCPSNAISLEVPNEL